MRLRALFVFGLAFFWPFVKAPFLMTFFGASAGVPDAVPFAFNGLALLCAAAAGMGGSRALARPAAARAVAVGAGTAASAALLVWTLARSAVWGGLLGWVALVLCAAAFAVLAGAWGAACVAGTRSGAVSSGRLAFDVGLSYLLSFACEVPHDAFAAAGALDAARACYAVFPVATALLWLACGRAMARGGEAVGAAGRGRGLVARVGQAASCDGIAAVLAGAPAEPAALRPVPGYAHANLLLCLVAVLALASGVLAGVYSDLPVGGSLLSVTFALPLVGCLWLALRRPVLCAAAWGMALVPVVMSAVFVIAYSRPLVEAGVNLLTAGRRTTWVLYWLLLVNVSCAAGGRDVLRRMGLQFVPLYALTRVSIDALRIAGVGSVLAEDARYALTVAVALVLVACSLAIVGLVVAEQYGAARSGAGAGGGTVFMDADGAGARQALDEGALDRELRHRACLALAGEVRLTERETDVLELVSMGYTVQRIAEERGVTQNTVRTHTKGLYRKLDLHSKQEIIDLVNDRIACV